MKQNFLILVCLLVGMTTMAQTRTRTLSTPNQDNEVGIEPLNDPGSALINVSNVTVNGQSDVVITRINGYGTVDWTKKYSMSSGHEIAHHFIIDRDTHVVVVGSVMQSGVQRGFILKTNAKTGAVIFASVTNSTNSGAYLRKVIQMNNGYSNDYVVLGTVNYPNTNIVARINSGTGAAVWGHSHNIALGSTDLIYTLCQTNNNKIILGGHFYNGTNNDHGVIQLNPVNGARLRVQAYNIVNGSANNGGFDDAVVIPGTDTVVFSMVLNGGGAASKHGFAVYSAGSNSLSAVRLNTIGSTNARATKIVYNAASRKILMGGISGVPLDNNFIHFVNASTYVTQSALTFNSGFNRTVYSFNSSWVSFISANTVMVGNTLIPTGSLPNGNDLVIARYHYGTHNACFDNVSITDATLSVPNQRVSSMDSTDEVINSASFNVTDTAFNDTLRCELYDKVLPPSGGSIYTGNVFPMPFAGVDKDRMLGMTAYPNPAKGVSSVELDVVNMLGLPTTITIYDAMGKVVRVFESGDLNIHMDFDVSELAKGMYVIQASNKELTQVQKLILN